ncbi:MAG: flagellar filament capping protein FliD [Anaerolineales bacterium]|nr:flagellar filament capping protein FliD [Anaerolineales bacterium]
MTTSTTSVGQLDAYFTNLISNLMTVERQPLTRLQKSRDTVTLQRNVYTDLNGKLKELQSAVSTLRDTAITSLSVGRKATTTPATSGATVLTATAAATATKAAYQVNVTALAREHRVWSNTQGSAGEALNLSGEFTVNDEAFTVAAGDSLNSLVVAINSRTYGANRGVTASVVDNRLVLTAQSMGIANSLALAETTGSPLQALGLFSAASTINASNELAALNASFSVNGVGITRSQNTGLTDVVEGVTLALANDAAGKSAALTISDDTATARSAIDAFITKFNDNQTYLEVKTALTATTENGKTTYTRGVLAQDTVFRDLRDQLFSYVMADAANAGAYQNLRDIGITLDDNLKVTVSDSTKLEAALTTHLSDVQALFEAAGSKFDTLLGSFTGVTTGYIDSAVSQMTSQLNETEADISGLSTRLVDREQSLVDQYAGIQALLIQMTYQKNQWASIYSGYSTTG